MAGKPETPAPRMRRFLRRAEVERITGFGRTHIYRLMQAEQFPKCVRLSAHVVGWDSTEMDAWIAQRLKERSQ